VSALFLQQAEEIFQAALQGGTEPAEWIILVHGDGAIRIVAGLEWDVEALRRDSGAQSAYRISRNKSRVALEARGAGENCRFESERQGVRRGALPDFPQYLMADPHKLQAGSGFRGCLET
jgi:hypothetical protein